MFGIVKKNLPEFIFKTFFYGRFTCYHRDHRKVAMRVRSNVLITRKSLNERPEAPPSSNEDNKKKKNLY